VTVYYLTASATADDIWSTTASKNDSLEELIDLSPTTFISSITGVPTIPANLQVYQSALVQQTNAPTASSSNLDIHWDKGIFNGMLFKDFVLNGCLFEYLRYTLQAATPATYASHINIEVVSDSAGTSTSYVWEPYENTAYYPMLYKQWITNTINEVRLLSIGSIACFPPNVGLSSE
jgi:hypothetical protein